MFETYDVTWVRRGWTGERRDRVVLEEGYSSFEDTRKMIAMRQNFGPEEIRVHCMIFLGEGILK